MKADRLALAITIKKKLERNQYKCALTGWPLTVDRFEIDHVVSLNDGGSNDAENLQCVHPLVNKAKGTMGNQQFIEMCKAVAELARKRELGL